MEVREIKNYDLCRNGSHVWLKNFDSQTEKYETIASTDKRFEMAGNILYFEGCGLFWMSDDFNSVAHYEESDGEVHFFGFVGMCPLFSKGEVFYMIEPNMEQPGEVKCLGKKLIEEPDFWAFSHQKENGLVVTYLEPHDNSRYSFVKRGHGVCRGKGISYRFEEKVFPRGYVELGKVCETDFGGQDFRKKVLFWRESILPGDIRESFEIYNSPGLF